MNVTTFDFSPVLTSIVEVAPRRVVTLQVEVVAGCQAVQTAEFELPDAEFDR